MTVDCNFSCGKGIIFYLCGVVSVGWIGEIFCCVVKGSVSSFSSFTRCDGVWISCCVKFLVALRVSSILLNDELKLLLLALSLNFALYF